MTEQIKFRKSDTVALLFSIFIPGMGQLYMDRVKVGVPIMIVWMVLAFFTFDNLVLESFDLTAYGYRIDPPTEFGPYLWLIVMVVVWLVALVHTKSLVDGYNESL